LKLDTVRWVPALIWITVFGIGCGFAITTTRIQTQLTLLLPSDGSPVQQLLVKHLSEGSISRLILIGLKGPRSHGLAAASSKLATLMRESGDFTYVRNGAFSSSMTDYELLYQYRYLLSPGVQPERFKMPELRKALEHRLQDMTAPLPPFIKNRIPDDPTGEFWNILKTWIPSKSPQKLHGVWFSSDGQYALLAAETKPSGFDLDAQEHIQLNIKDAVSRLNKEYIPDAGIQLVQTGPAVFAVDSRATIKKEAQWLSFLATTLVIGFLFARFRSLALVGLSVMPLASGLLAGLIGVNFVYGFIHGITLAFGITLIGVAIDYPIHLFSHLYPPSSPSRVLDRIWPIMRLGALTTAVGYGAMLFSGFPGLSQLGLFAIVGLLTAAIVTKWILPSFIPKDFAVAPLPKGFIDRIDLLPNFSLLIPFVMILSLIYLGWSDKPFWEEDLANLSPISQKSKRMDSWFRKELGAPDVRDIIVLTSASEQEILEQSEQLMPTLDQLVRQEALTGYDMASRYLPSVRMQHKRQAALPETHILEKQLSHAREGLPFKAGIFRTFIQDIAAGKNLPPLVTQRLQNTVLESKIKSLLFHEEGQWVGIITLQGVKDRTRLASLSTKSNEGNVHYLDLKQESNRMVTTYRQEMMKFLSLGAVAIMVLLGFVLRSPSAVVRVLLPMITAAMTVVAVLHLVDEKLSLFHLASMLLVVGIGLDYTLFFNREHQSEAERIQTILAVLVCAVTTILVFGLLALSQTPVLHSIGSTAALGAFCCLLFSAMFRKRSIAQKHHLDTQQNP
jgi:predicted exporter